MNEMYDLAVIGGGSAGYNAASTAVRLGLRTLVVDGAPELGGLCILRGCMPSKTLIESANRYMEIGHAAEFGIDVAGHTYAHERILERKRRLVAEFADYRREQLFSRRFDFLHGTAAFTDPNTLEVQLLAGGTAKVNSRTFLIATGSRIHHVDIPGLMETGFMTSDHVLELEQVPKSVVILGGGATALEFAHYFSALGVQVSLIQRSSQILREADADVAHALTEALVKRGVSVHCHTRLKEIRRHSSHKVVSFEHAGTLREIEAEEIICALGRVPRLEGLALERAGVLAQAGQLTVNNHQQTNVPHVFAAGDAAGPYEIVHIAIQQAEVAVRNAARLIQGGAMEETDYRLKLFAVFTEPQLAFVGATEKELLAAGTAYSASQYPFADHGKSIVAGAVDGFVKLLAHSQSREILGAAAVGPHASELIHEMAVAMHFRATAQDLLKVPHYHPTLSEIWTYPAEELSV